MSLTALHVILAHDLQGGEDQMMMYEMKQLTGRVTERSGPLSDVSPSCVTHQGSNVLI